MPVTSRSRLPWSHAASAVVGALVVLGCDVAPSGPDASGLDVPGLDVPGLDAPGLDAPGLDAPPADGESPRGLSCMGPTVPPPPMPACPPTSPSGCTPGSPAPIGYWRFEAADRTRDETGRWPLRAPSGADGDASFGTDGAVGGHLAMRTAAPNNNARVYVPYTAAYPAALTLELLVRFRPGTLFFEDIRVVRMMGGAELQLSRDGWSFGRVEFPLDGDDVTGWPYYTDGRWHHLALVANGSTVSLAVDGRHPEEWTRPGSLPTGSGPGIYFGYFAEAASQGLDMDLDEVAFYGAALPSSVLAQHAADALAGRPYGADACAVDWCTPRTTDPTLDPLDYVPGWSATDWRAASIDPLTQLTSFPLPRFRAGHALPRIPSIWVNPDYFGGQFEQVPGTYASRFPLATVAEQATALQLELAERWHQGLARHSRTTAAWVAYANAHPEIQLGTASFWSGRVGSLSPSEEVADGPVDCTRAECPASPALDPAIFAPDGAASRDALVRWASTAGVTRSFDLVVENGETPVDAMHGLVEADLASNPAASAHWTANRSAFGGDFRAYISTRERDFIRAYRDAFLAPRAADRPAALREAMFTYYEIDGYGTYSPEWSIIRDALGTYEDGRPRAATSFYPRRAAWWFTGSSAWHGWDWIRRSRPDEIAAGDLHFWPLVAAGWAFHEERNLRPAQWLAILESLSVAGADATMPAYFVIPGCGGGFGGATDCDCPPEPTTPDPEASRLRAACLSNVVQNRASYAWQAVMPSYAQGIASRYDDLLRDPASVWRTDVVSPDPGALAVVRQAGRRFVIAVSTHTLSNERTGRTYAERVVPVRLDVDGEPSSLETLRLLARPQGAVYLLDAGVNPPTLRWLDAWHEATHPAYWSRDFAFEAEVDDGRVEGGGVSLVTRTERAPGASAWDFAGATSYLAASTETFAELPPGAAPRASFAFTPRTDTAYGVWVRARTRGRAGTVRISVDAGAPTELGCIREGTWTWVRLACPAGAAADLGTLSAGPHTLHVEPSSTDVEIDAVRLTADEVCFADAVDCGGCG